jgi:hypothetical protein
LCRHVLCLFLCGISLVVESLGHMVSLCLTFWGVPIIFPKQLNHITSPLTWYESSIYPLSPTLAIICCI